MSLRAVRRRSGDPLPSIVEVEVDIAELHMMMLLVRNWEHASRSQPSKLSSQDTSD